MTQEEAREQLILLSKQYPDATSLSVEYFGSGDSFESFHDYTISVNGAVRGMDDMDSIEDLLWWALEQSDADFNNDGSRGSVILRFRPQLGIDVEVEHYVTETVPGNGFEVDFENGANFVDEVLAL